MSAAIGNRILPPLLFRNNITPILSLQYTQLTLLTPATPIVFKPQAWLPGNAADREGKPANRLATINVYIRMPAQRPAEVLGTLMHAQLPIISNPLHYAPY